jgi:multidrug efflux pump subunit AcrA (membrane-fusion protein)
VASGILVLKDGDGDRFAPAAFWPEGRRPRQHLAEAAERALQQRRAVVAPVGPSVEGDLGARLRYDIAQPVESNGELYGVIALDVSPHSERDVQTVIRQLQWGAAWLEVGRLRNDAAQAAVVRDRFKTVLDLLALTFGHERFTAAAVAFVTAVATRIGADRVTLGFLRGGRARVVAVSHTARFGRNSNVVRGIEQAMDEAIDQRALVVWPQPPDWRPQVARAHAEFSRQQGVAAICTAPLIEGERVLGALTVERPADQPFDAVAFDLIEVLAALAGPVLDRARRDDRWIGAKILDACRDSLGRLLGPRHVGLKVSVAVAAAVLIFVSVASGTFRVAANAVLEPVVRQALVAPFPGYIAEAPARAGDVLKPGAVLAALDDRELRLSRLKWLSQREQLTRQYQQAMAIRNAAAVVIFSAQIEQARAEIALLDYQLARTTITAPFPGIVVMGDLSQSLAAPVERGQVLFEIAPLDSYRVVLQVDEHDIAYVRVGQRGTLVLTGTPSESLPFAVEKITPVSTAREGHNYFRVEAKLDQHLDKLRPGMEGLGKVAIDQRLFIWIWTRQIVDWVRLQLWTWLP